MSGKPSFPACSLYIHIPFCRKKCGYCHFYVLPDQEALKDELLQGLLLEWSRVGTQLQQYEVVSIYLGGGTPTLFGAERTQRLLDAIARTVPLSETAEITIEGNPEDINSSSMADYLTAGVNRVSIGIQSLDDKLLTTLTRQHSAQDAVQAVYDVKDAGFENVSIDLMYDLPGQTLDTWRSTLEHAARLPIQHLSLYNLTIEPHTPFFKKRHSLQQLLPSQELSAEMYPLAVEVLNARGLEQYEVSAFARSGALSRHNSGYWLGRPFVGLGPSAFSFWKGRRYRNVANQRKYIDALQKNQSPIDFEETLEPMAAQREQFVLALRLCSGALKSQYVQVIEQNKDALSHLNQLGLVKCTDQKIYLTDKGRLYYDSVAVELI